MKYIFSMTALWVVSSVSAQRLSVGINVNTPVISFIHFTQNYYNPIQSNRIFMVNAPGAEKEKYSYTSVFFGKMYTVGGLGWGTILKLNYKRFSVRGGFKFSYQHDKIKLNEFEYDGELSEYKAEFNLQTLRYNFPLFVTIDLKRSNSSPYLILGAETGFFTFADETIDWDSSYDKLFLNYLYGIFYDNYTWTNADIGIGKKMKRTELSMNYKFRIDDKKDLLSIKKSFIELNFIYFIKDNSLNRKHYLYRGED